LVCRNVTSHSFLCGTKLYLSQDLPPSDEGSQSNRDHRLDVVFCLSSISITLRRLQVLYMPLQRIADQPE
jgi:hypothetical protein